MLNGEAPEANVAVNRQLSQDEIEKAVCKLKNRKSTGPDCVPNEVLKCKEIHDFLFNLFQCCFENGMVPSMWRKALIKPIPKGSAKDPYVPLNYRGISLLSCVSKFIHQY